MYTLDGNRYASLQVQDVLLYAGAQPRPTQTVIMCSQKMLRLPTLLSTVTTAQT